MNHLLVYNYLPKVRIVHIISRHNISPMRSLKFQIIGVLPAHTFNIHIAELQNPSSYRNEGQIGFQNVDTVGGICNIWSGKLGTRQHPEDI